MRAENTASQPMESADLSFFSSFLSPEPEGAGIRAEVCFLAAVRFSSTLAANVPLPLPPPPPPPLPPAPPARKWNLRAALERTAAEVEDGGIRELLRRRRDW